MHTIQIEKRSKLTRAELTELFVYLNETVWKNTQTESIPIGKLSGRISRNLLTSPDAPIPDCLTCGVCCVLTFDVQLTQEDKTRPEHYWDIATDGSKDDIIVNRVLRRDCRTGRCLNLAGETGKDIKCEIYEQRPEACRRFDAGSDKCHALRRASGIEPPLAQYEIFDALMKILDQDSPESDERLMVYDCEIARRGKSRKLTITVWTEDGRARVIHEFEAKNEKWLEGNFIGLTLTEARELIASPPDNKEANPTADNFI